MSLAFSGSTLSTSPSSFSFAPGVSACLLINASSSSSFSPPSFSSVLDSAAYALIYCSFLSRTSFSNCFYLMFWSLRACLEAYDKQQHTPKYIVQHRRRSMPKIRIITSAVVSISNSLLVVPPSWASIGEPNIPLSIFAGFLWCRLVMVWASLFNSLLMWPFKSF